MVVLVIMLYPAIFKKGSGRKKTTTATTGTTTTTTTPKSRSNFWNSFWTVVVALIILGMIFAFITYFFRGDEKRVTKNSTENTKPIKEGKTRETYIATKSGTQVYMETQDWSSVLYGKVKVTPPEGEIKSYYDEPGVKNKTHNSAGWYTFYSVENGDVEFEIWQ